MNASRRTIAPRIPQKSTRILVLQGHVEEAEDHREDEDVVHRQRPLDQVAGEELDAGLVPRHQKIRPLKAAASPHQNRVASNDSPTRACDLAMEHDQVQRQADGHQGPEGEPVP